MGDGGTLMIVGYVVFFIAIFYFLLIRPQSKQKKQREQMMQQVSVGTEIYTVGGILGRITRVKEKTVWLKVCDKVEIEVFKTSIGGILTPDANE